MKCGSTSSISLKALGPGYTVRTATCFRYNRNVNNIDRYDRRLIIAVAP